MIAFIGDSFRGFLKYLEIAGAGEKTSITSNGRLLATITAPAQQRDAAKKKLKALTGRAKIHDVIAPLHEDWDALS